MEGGSEAAGQQERSPDGGATSDSKTLCHGAEFSAERADKIEEVITASVIP